MRIAGNKVNAPKLEPNILRAISIPKYCNGTMSEKIRTKNPTDTEIKLMKIALPLIMIVSPIAALTFPVDLKLWLKWEII